MRRLRALAPTLTFVGLLLCARSSLADHYYIPSESMQPALEPGDRILVNKMAYHLRVPFSSTTLVSTATPRRGDVILFRSQDNDEILIKRVIALAGERVAVRRDQVFIDGVPLTLRACDGGDRSARLPCLCEEHDGTCDALGPSFGLGPDLAEEVVPNGTIFVLGDNRGNSRDGRFFGAVSTQQIVGRATAVFARDGALRWIPL